MERASRAFDRAAVGEGAVGGIFACRQQCGGHREIGAATAGILIFVVTTGRTADIQIYQCGDREGGGAASIRATSVRICG